MVEQNQVLPVAEIIGERKEIRIGDRDYRLFSYTLRYRRRTWPAYVYVDRAAMESPSESLPHPLKENVETEGRAALEESIRGFNVPKRIFVDSFGGITEQDRKPGQISSSWTVRLLVGLVFGYYCYWLLGDFGVPRTAAWLIAVLLGVLLVISFKLLVEYLFPGSAPPPLEGDGSNAPSGGYS